MPLVNVTRKAVTLQGFQLTSNIDMMTALAYVSQGNYAGTIYCTKVGQTVNWQLVIQSLVTNASQSGFINHWVIIENGTVVKIVSDTEFTALYTVA